MARRMPEDRTAPEMPIAIRRLVNDEEVVASEAVVIGDGQSFSVEVKEDEDSLMLRFVFSDEPGRPQSAESKLLSSTEMVISLINWQQFVIGAGPMIVGELNGKRISLAFSVFRLEKSRLFSYTLTAQARTDGRSAS
jgi:hypothetical protein